MARLKFLLFSIVVVALWGAHFFLLAPAISSRALEATNGAARSASSAVLAEVEAQRATILEAALSVASNPEVLSAVRAGRGEAPTAATVDAVRTAVVAKLSGSLKDALFLGVLTTDAGLGARGTEAAAAFPAELTDAQLPSAQGKGVVRDVFGAPHLFVAVPVETVEREGTKQWGHVVVGAPLITAESVEAAAKRSGVDGLALMKDGQVAFAAGAKQALVRTAAPKATEKATVVERGSLSSFGPAKLPLLTDGDVLGGKAPLYAAVKTSLGAIPFDVAAVTSLSPLMGGLAEYQQTALLMFAALLVLALVFLALMRSAPAAAVEEEEDRDETPAPAPAPVAAVAAEEPAPELAAAEAAAAEVAPRPSPDEFPFGPAPSALPEAPAQETAEPEQVEQAAPAEPPASFGGNDWAQPLPPQGADPFAQPWTNEQPSAQNELGGDAYLGAPPAGAQDDFNPEATRVAAVPHELLQAAAQASDPEPEPAPSPYFAPPPVQAAPAFAGNEDDLHFQEVFREFLQTRESCGEPADGLTFERFALKLRKNREQLVAKYSCRTVRFQVYVKEGKAALKATPIKD